MNNIRITSGKYRGRLIKTPGAGTHPMGAREKLALFNMITDYLQGAKVLDAYAGSGALGIEALSRGASEVAFVEKNPQAAKVIRENLNSLDLKARVVVDDVVNFTISEKFDVVLADPPYDNYKSETVEHLAKMVREGGILALSHPGEAPQPFAMTLEKSRSYAGATISIYRIPPKLD